jgi:hypothetical protein
MKKLMLGLAMAVCHWLPAQTPKDSLNLQLQHVFSQIDPTKVTTGRIFERGLSFTDPLYFSAQNTEKVDGAFQHFAMLYNSLQTAEMDNRHSWPTLETLVLQSETHPRNVVPLFLMDVDFEYLKEEALAQNHIRL